MQISANPAHETERILNSSLSVFVRESTIQQAQSWITGRLEQLSLHPDEQQRIGRAVSQKIETILEKTGPGKLGKLTIRLFSAGDRWSSAQGWGFFIIHTPVNAARGVVEVYIYHEPML